jgi:hypothetical protein
MKKIDLSATLFAASLVALLAFAACGDGSQPGSVPGGAGSAGTPAASSGQSSGGPGVGNPRPSSGSGAGSGGNTGGPSSGAVQSSGAAVSGVDAATAAPDASPASTDASAATCDRACLLAMMQKYLDALVAHDATKIPTASTLKYTENGVVAKLGDGLWTTASMVVAGERLDFADPTAGQVASQLVVNENGTTPVIYQARLKVAGGEITEIETVAVRQTGAANGFFQPANLKPQPVFAQAIDPSNRMTRDQLTALMNVYLDYLEGKKTGSMVPFDTNCTRYENGVATATGVASFNAQSWSFSVVRRILILDEEAGIVWGMFPFEMTDTALVVGEAFKMIGGKIMMIQAVMTQMPAKAWN